jgi:diaminopimelate epimerase
MTRRFWKYHGLGNDFVLVEEPVTAAAAQALCDRRRGVGADGVLVVTTGAGDVAADVAVWNSDGSSAEICGNGLRCVALHLCDRPAALSGAFRLATGAATTSCRIVEHERPGHAVVEVEMGRPTVLPAEVPVDADGDRVVDRPFTVAGRSLPITAVGMGNPHAVTFGDYDLDAVRALGPALERHAAFPAGVNAGFARVAGPGRVDLTVWERGAGLTGACGSGACAAAVAACLTGRAGWGTPLVVRQPGGDLVITARGLDATVSMRGPAARVFAGEVDLEALRH